MASRPSPSHSDSSSGIYAIDSRSSSVSGMLLVAAPDASVSCAVRSGFPGSEVNEDKKQNLELKGGGVEDTLYTTQRLRVLHYHYEKRVLNSETNFERNVLRPAKRIGIPGLGIKVLLRALGMITV